MNKKLHFSSPRPDDFDKLDITFLPENRSNSFLFEPKELVQFETAWNWQKHIQEGLLKGTSSKQAIWLLQHDSCYTLGRGADENNLLFDSRNPPCNLYRINRGGEVTYHCPGQLVVYLALDLRRYKTDLYWYLRQLEQVLIDLLIELDLPGEQINGYTGIWCNNFKVASIGIGCKRWITQHGMALNINCDLTGFDQIVPCGISGAKIGKIESWIPGITVEQVQPLMLNYLEKRFALIWNN
tara:strand:- start:10665 stop:11384 length:720 start_codon:yes stop_codon:yes gene_type:complete